MTELIATTDPDVGRRLANLARSYGWVPSDEVMLTDNGYLVTPRLSAAFMADLRPITTHVQPLGCCP